jgi:hypothetical protein
VSATGPGLELGSAWAIGLVSVWVWDWALKLGSASAWVIDPA